MNKALLPYGVSTLDPAIEIPDTSIVKDKIKRNVETKITARFDELQREAQVVMDIFNINKKMKIFPMLNAQRRRQHFPQPY